MAALEPLRVLLVENQPFSGCDLAVSLGAMGHMVVASCHSGLDALRHGGDLTPDLAIVDLRLRGVLDGVEAGRKLARRHQIAIVYLCEGVDEATLARAQDAEASGFLWDSSRTDEVRITVDMAVRRHRREKDNVRRERRLFQAFHSWNEGVIGSDFAGRIRFLNPEAERLTGWTEQEAAGKMLEEIYAISHEDGQAVPILPECGFGSSAARKVQLTRRGGGSLSIEDRVAPVKDDDGSLNGLVIVFRPALGPVAEATPSALPRVATTGQAAPLAQIVESISDPLAALDANWRFTYANSSAARLFERNKASLAGKSLWDVWPPSVREAHQEELIDALQRQVTITREVYLEENQTWFEARTYPFGAGLLLLLKDITAKKLEAERNHRMDRLESLGLLARGFAHDFNNLLTVLLGNLALAEMRFGGGPEQHMELETAKQATLQAQNLVQQLQTFARGGSPIKRMVSLSVLVKAFFHSHPRVDRVHYFVEVQEDMPEASLDPNQFRRLLSNLVRNAEQALPLGGEIRVRCEAADAAQMFPNETVNDDPLAHAGVTLEVHDSGEGIPSENLKRIFEPYFTTRQDDNATGLGLTVCESIAKAHGGSISVSSQPGKGTLVRFFMPVDAEAEEADLLELGQSFLTKPMAPSRILLLEDDHLVRTLILRGLQRDGYEVEETLDGNETVRRYEQARSEGRPFDLVVLDLSIPNGMGGLRTMEKLRDIDPEVLAIVSSGYSDDPVMAHPASAGFAAVLPKPYEPMDLLRLVKTVLNRRKDRRQA